MVDDTYQQACADSGAECDPLATGSIPAALKQPLHLPILRPGDACPATLGATVTNGYFGGIALGSGPVRPLIAMAGDVLHGTTDLASDPGGPGWLAFKTLWFSEPAYQGPWSVRAERLDGPGQIAFGASPPKIAALVVPPGPTVNSRDGYRTVPGLTWVTAPGCYGWQVDGLTFTEVIVVKAVVPVGSTG